MSDPIRDLLKHLHRLGNLMVFRSIRYLFTEIRYWLFTGRRRWFWLAVLLLGALFSVIMFWVSQEPPLFDVERVAQQHADRNGQPVVTGSVTTATMIEIAETLLDKRGGYISNDLTPPFVFLDNMPSWEFGVLLQTRDLARVMRNDISRSQTQSTEDVDLAIADPQLHFNHNAWLLPATEHEYQEAIVAMSRYQQRLADTDDTNAQFFARADNLRDYLAQVEKRLGSISQRLSASIGQQRLNTDLSGDSTARQSTSAPTEISVKTPWLQIDNVFFEARGTTWALIHYFRAMEVDFANVLADKNAEVSYRQIIRELEATQRSIGSPMILNGSAFGLFSNHSLVMANYIARANAAIIDLRSLLEQG